MITAQDVDNIYEIPLLFHQEGLDDRLVETLNIWTRAPRLEVWEKLGARIKHPKDRVEIGIVGKYVDLRESYKSLHEALVHGGLANEVQVALTYIDSERVEREGPEGLLGHLHGILVPGGFGVRGVEGKILAIQLCPGAANALLRHLFRHAAGGHRICPPSWPASPAPPAKNFSPRPSTPSST